MGEKRVDQSTAAMARRRMGDKTGRLIDDDKVGVLINDLQRDVFGQRERIDGGRELDGDFFSGLDLPAGDQSCRALDRHFAIGNKGLKSRAAYFGKALTEIAIKTLAVVFGSDGRRQTDR